MMNSYTDRMAPIGWTDAARWAGASLAVTAVRMAIAAPATYASRDSITSYFVT